MHISHVFGRREHHIAAIFSIADAPRLWCMTERSVTVHCLERVLTNAKQAEHPVENDQNATALPVTPNFMKPVAIADSMNNKNKNQAQKAPRLV